MSMSLGQNIQSNLLPTIPGLVKNMQLLRQDYILELVLVTLKIIRMKIFLKERVSGRLKLRENI